MGCEYKLVESLRSGSLVMVRPLARSLAGCGSYYPAQKGGATYVKPNRGFKEGDPRTTIVGWGVFFPPLYAGILSPGSVYPPCEDIVYPPARGLRGSNMGEGLPPQG